MPFFIIVSDFGLLTEFTFLQNPCYRFHLAVEVDYYPHLAAVVGYYLPLVEAVKGLYPRGLEKVLLV